VIQIRSGYPARKSFIPNTAGLKIGGMNREKKLPGNWLTKGRNTSVTLARGMQWGLIGGLAGTIAMDLVLVGGLSALGLPTYTCFLSIGSTVAHFFSLLGIKLSGSVMLGVAMFHLLGPVLSAIYGLAASQVGALQGITLKKNVVWAVLYAEVLSQLILTTMPILLKMSGAETVLWFAESFILHLTWGIVLGFVMHYGLLAKSLTGSVGMVAAGKKNGMQYGRQSTT
jgi:hypothetical protein